MADGDFDLLDAQRAVFRSTLRAPAKLVALALLDHWSRRSETFPSVERLAAWTSQDRRTVLRCLHELEQTGAIVVKRSSGRPNVYALGSLMALPVSESHRCQPGTSVTESPVTESHPCQSITPPVTESHGTSVTESPEGTQEGTQEGTHGESAHEPTEPTEPPKPGRRRAKRAKRSRAPEVPLPADWSPNAAHRAYAAKHGLDLETVADAMRGWAEGRTTVSWDGTFTTWLANRARWDRKDAQRKPVQQGRYRSPTAPATPTGGSDAERF